MPKGKGRVALYGLMVALAFVLSYLEALFPLPIGIPGIKPGLANLVVVVALYRLGAGHALGISCVRILLAGLTFGSPVTMIYSFCGGLMSFAAMVLCRRTGRLSVYGVSMAGGVFHNVGQILAAMAALQTVQVAWYLPILLPVGLLTGGLNGFLAAQIQRRSTGKGADKR